MDLLVLPWRQRQDSRTGRAGWCYWQQAPSCVIIVEGFVMCFKCFLVLDDVGRQGGGW